MPSAPSANPSAPKASPSSNSTAAPASTSASPSASAAKSDASTSNSSTPTSTPPSSTPPHPPILFTEHGRHFPDYPRPKRIFANRFLLKPTDRVTAVGNYVRQLLIANERIAPNRITVVHNGIDPDRFASTDRTQARQLLSLADDELAILHVARFHPVKDHATALRAFSRIVTQSPRARLILVGDGAQRPTIEALVRELSLHHHVRLLGVRDDIPQLLLAADLFILTSLSEGISVTLLEAMAARLPIAATDVGGNSEVVDHNHTGLLSPRSDDQALASNLLTLLNDPALRQRMGNAGRQRLLDHFTQDKMHHAYAGIYQQMIA
jgi:glycosyltransferase involved in cell wall biosynthesis